MWRWFKWVLLGIGILAILGVAISFLKPREKNDESAGKPAQFIQADFIDLEKIVAISKFRSGSGHDFSQETDETCRSMKHYYNVQNSAEGERLRSQNNGLPPAPDGKTDIKIYSPVDGRITSIQSEKMPIGEQIYIKPNDAPDYTIRLFHIYKLGGIKDGSAVKAGEQIGNIGQYQNTDIAIEGRRGFNSQFISYFEVMPDAIFAKYLARGVKNRDELIITKAYRDAHPLECNGERFAQNYDSDPNSGNMVYLSGYNSGY
ncbi:MAG TPA: hypothetical protein VJL27_03355 [Patescibacteria group bacterium]|nr:hypothetical protein [Patescibacteria group bacterium]